MKVIGDWILIEPLSSQSDSGILSSAMDRGRVISVNKKSMDAGIKMNDIVIFDLNNVSFKHPDFWAVDFKWIFAIQ
tara:strand:+ start:276 stop:503 length:228 start_codon:yes stop_codon:yes gene_type:complete